MDDVRKPLVSKGFLYPQNHHPQSKAVAVSEFPLNVTPVFSLASTSYINATYSRTTGKRFLSTAFSYSLTRLMTRIQEERQDISNLGERERER